jgi:hypothetical protein
MHDRDGDPTAKNGRKVRNMFIRPVQIRSARALAVIGLLGFIAGAATPGRADEGRCLITVEGRTYLKGRCNIEIRPGGSFTVGAGEYSRSKYFASVILDENSRTAHGYWNGAGAEDHAHVDLLELTRNGACWSNKRKRARICAWR